MRPLDEVARLWSEKLLRASWARVPWSWPLAAAAGGVLLVLVGTSSSHVPAQPDATRATVAAVSPVNCQEQTWPFLSDACLQRGQAATGRQAKPVRVVHHEPATAAAAIGATEWTRRATPWPNQPQARQKQKNQRQKDHEPNRPRTVTVRSGRRDVTPQRVYVVPTEGAYHAYGYAPR